MFALSSQGQSERNRNNPAEAIMRFPDLLPQSALPPPAPLLRLRIPSLPWLEAAGFGLMILASLT